MTEGVFPRNVCARYGLISLHDRRACITRDGNRDNRMKLYDYKLAPNPRRVRIFLAKKGISVPLEEITALGVIDFAKFNNISIQPDHKNLARRQTVSSCPSALA
jgi:hypothetical protein